MDRKYYVYEHRRNDTGAAFYVGKGSKNRAWSRNHRSSWWKRIADTHGYSVVLLYENISENEAFRLEVDIIKSYGRDNLCNMTDGGEGNSGGKRSDETKEKLRAKKLGSQNPNYGKTATSETRAKMSVSRSGEKAYWFGKSHSAETKAKISHASSGRTLSDDAKRKISASSTGRKVREETKKKIGNSKIGKPRPKSVIDALVNANSKKIGTMCGKLFNSGSDAILWLKENGHPKASAAAISRSARSVSKGKRRIAYGFYWQFCE